MKGAWVVCVCLYIGRCEKGKDGRASGSNNWALFSFPWVLIETSDLVYYFIHH